MYNAIFGAPVDPPDVQLTKWKDRIHIEQRELDNRIRELDRLELETKVHIKTYAKEGEPVSVRIMSKELQHVQKCKTKMYEIKVTLNSVILQLSEQLVHVRISKAFALSTQVMKQMNQMINLPMIGRVMRDLSREMAQAGLIRDVLYYDNANLDEVEVTEAADAEVDAFLVQVAKELKLPDLAQPVITTSTAERTAKTQEKEKI